MDNFKDSDLSDIDEQDFEDPDILDTLLENFENFKSLLEVTETENDVEAKILAQDKNKIRVKVPSDPILNVIFWKSFF